MVLRSCNFVYSTHRVVFWSMNYCFMFANSPVGILTGQCLFEFGLSGRAGIHICGHYRKTSTIIVA